MVSQYEITSKCQDKTNRDTRPIIGLYQRVIAVKPYSGNYILSFAQCCRNNSVNLSNINDMPSQGINLRAEFSTQYINSTPVNQIYRYLNQGILTNWYLESYDKEEDSIVHVNRAPYHGGTPSNSTPTPNGTLVEPLETIYNSGYSVLNPFGPEASFELNENLITVNSTGVPGQYHIAFDLLEYRNGIHISSKSVDMTIWLQVANISNSNIPYNLKVTSHAAFETRLSWENCDNQVDRYDVLRKEESEALFTSVGFTEGPQLSFIDLSIIQSGTYHYYIVGVPYDQKLSGLSDTASIGWYNASYKDQVISKSLIYPNPASEILKVKSEDQISTITITNALGKILISKPEVNNLVCDISLKNIEKGSYYITIFTESSIIVNTFIKL